MKYKQYVFGRFFLILYFFAALLQGIIYLLIGSKIFGLEFFPGWLLVSNLIYGLAIFFLLKYYHHKQYLFTLVAGTVAVLASLFFVFVLYQMLMTRELNNWYIAALSTMVVAGIVYAISMIISPAGKNKFLLAAGVVILIVNLLGGIDLILYTISPKLQASFNMDKIGQWTSLASSLVPLLFIKQFSRELKFLKIESMKISRHWFSESYFSFVGIIAVIAIFGFGGPFAMEGFRSLYWENKNFEKSQELAQIFEARTFVGSQGDRLLYRLLKPLDYDPQKKYPLVVSLHHGGDHGSDNIRQTGSQPSAILSTDENRKKYPAFHFVPQCPEGSTWNDNSFYTAIDSLVFETIHAQEQEFSIDEKRRYVGGISGGGFGSWHFIGTRPNMFAAAIPICGGGDPGLAEKMVNVSVWAFHGEKDKLAPVSGSRDVVDAIKKAGGNPRYTEFPGAGHNIWNSVIETPGVLDWLFAQKRE